MPKKSLFSITDLRKNSIFENLYNDLSYAQNPKLQTYYNGFKLLMLSKMTKSTPIYLKQFLRLMDKKSLASKLLCYRLSI